MFLLYILNVKMKNINSAKNIEKFALEHKQGLDKQCREFLVLSLLWGNKAVGILKPINIMMSLLFWKLYSRGTCAQVLLFGG